MTALSDDLTWRGLVYQTTDDELLNTLDARPITLYQGFDPTAPSLHLGNLVGLLALRRFQLAGHKPIPLAGGGTGMIGDPGGRSDERNLLDAEVLEANVESIRPQLEAFLDFGKGKNKAVLVNNMDWISKLSVVEFLRDTGKHFTVNQMVAKDSVRERFENRDTGISYTEFSYMLLQAEDFLHLYEKYDCELQIGGSDQWGNITAGVDLIRRRLGKKSFGLTIPLLLKDDGTKFGKSADGSVWLDPKMTPPFAMYQFLIQSADADVENLLKRFSFRERGEIEELVAKNQADPSSRVAQSALAFDVVSLVHGEAEAKKCQESAKAIFTNDLTALDESQLKAAFSEAPTSSASRNLLDDGYLLVDALLDTNLVSSKSNARTTIEQGGVYVNDARAESIEQVLKRDDLLHDKYIILRRGKKDHHLLSFS